jgi:hypothetical protein
MSLPTADIAMTALVWPTSRRMSDRVSRSKTWIAPSWRPAKRVVWTDANERTASVEPPKVVRSSSEPSGRRSQI